MKRKPSQELICAPAPKRVDSSDSKISREKPSRLLEIISQYGLLAMIASKLFPQDLYALAATSKSAYKAIFPSDDSRSNLLSKMQCAGIGVAIRNSHHQKSVYFAQYNCIEKIQCGSQNTTQKVKSKPCVSCGKVTCDECRIHCVYGSIQQPPTDPEELPELSGFVLLSRPEMRILTSAHMPATEPDSVHVVSDSLTTVPTPPYHDQGFLDTPIESDSYAKVQPIDAILDFDLGTGPLQLSDSSTEPHPSPVIQAFWDVSEGRKRWMCPECYSEYTKNLPDPCSRLNRCCCTLRKFFVDRWLCLPCYQIEQEAFQETEQLSSGNCFCCCNNTCQAKMTCIWCWGEVL